MVKVGTFPKTVFVAWERCENDDPCPLLFESPDHTATIGTVRKVGVYELKKIVAVSTKIEVQ